MRNQRTIRLINFVLIVLLAVGGVALAVQSVYKAGVFNSDVDDPQAKWNDLRAYYGAAQWVTTETDIYANPTSPEGRYYVYPPFFAILCAPVAVVGWKVFALFWCVASLVSLIAASVLCARIVRPGAKGSLLVLFAAAALILTARPIISDFQNGQINTFVFFLVAASLFLFLRRFDAASGIVVGFAAAIKPTFVIFLPYFIFKGAYKTAGGMLLALVFALVLLPLVTLGPTRTSELYTSFYSRILGPFTSVSEAPREFAGSGQSLRAAAHNFLTDTNAAHHSRFAIKVNFANLSAGAVWKIVLGACAVLAVLTALCARANLAHKEKRDLAALELASVLLLMLLVSPLSRKAHFVALMLPYAAGVNYLLLHRGSIPLRGRLQVLLAAVAASFILINLTSRSFVGKYLSTYFLAFSVFFFAAIMLWAAVCLLLAGPRVHTTVADSAED